MSHSSTPREVTRRGFISDLTVGAGGALALSALLPAGADAGELSLPAGTAAEWDMSWAERLTGKYRTVFDSPEINDGTVFTNASVFMNGFAEVYKAADADAQAVIVMRHRGVYLAFNDAMWEKYGIGADLKVPNAEKRNPWTSEIAALKTRGATLIACNLAANRRAMEIAQRVGADRQQVHDDLYANFVPGTIVMPSGVFATIRAQQAGCAFLKSA
jgi:intracellular sulfur oxidation DsrE/DsrF family protein